MRPCGPVIQTNRWPTVPIAPGDKGAGALGLDVWLAATKLEGDGPGPQIPRVFTTLAGSSVGDDDTDANAKALGGFGRPIGTGTTEANCGFGAAAGTAGAGAGRPSA